MRQSVLPLVLTVACWFGTSGLSGQDRDEFLLPADDEIQQLLKAIEAYQEATRSDRGFVDPAYLINSLEQLEARLSADSSTSEVNRLAVPLLYFRINLNDRAVKVLENYLVTHPESPRATLLLAFGYLREEKYLQAREQASRAMRLDPGSAYTAYLLGLSQLGLNQIEEAQENFEQSVSLDSTFAEAHFQLGLLHSQNPEDTEIARDSLEKALSLGLEQSETYTSLGSVLAKLGQHEEAVAQLEKAVQLRPDGTEAHYLLAQSYRKLGNKDQELRALEQFAALKATERGLAAKEAEGRTYFERALKLLHAETDQLEEAYQLFQKTIDIFPGMASAYYRLAQIDYLRKRNERSLEYIRQAIQLNPLEPEYYFILARCLEKSDPGAAAEAIRRAISLKPEVADFHNLLGNLLFGQRDYSDAVLAYRQASRLQSDNPVFHLNLSAALAETGAAQESRKEKELYFELLQGKKP